MLCQVLILFIGILNIINTVYSNIHTRIGEIGMQRAIGISIVDSIETVESFPEKRVKQYSPISRFCCLWGKFFLQYFRQRNLHKTNDQFHNTSLVFIYTNFRKKYRIYFEYLSNVNKTGANAALCR